MATRRKAPAKKKAVAKSSPKKDVVPVEERLAALAAEEAEKTQGSAGNMVSIRNGRFSYQGNDLGEEIDVIVLNHAFVNAYYDSVYDPENPAPPACFAIAINDDGMAPHEDSPNPQGDEEEGTCVGCWANQFGSDNRGRGKACKNNRRLAIISAHDGWEDSLDEPNVAYLSVPPTSLSAWRGYANKIAKGLRKPTFAFVTRMSFDGEEDYPKLQFDMLTPVSDMGTINSLLNVREEINDELLAPFSTEGYESPEERKPRGKKAPAKKKSAGGRSKFSK